MSSNFHVHDTNPNDITTGACVCHKGKTIGCEGPFVVFPEQELEDVSAPHVVMCKQCINEAKNRIDEHEDHRAKQDEFDAEQEGIQVAPLPPVHKVEPSTSASLEDRFSDPDPEREPDDTPEV